MRKRCKRRLKNISEPGMVTLLLTPEIGVIENMALQHLRMGTADYENTYRVLADLHGMLQLARIKTGDQRIAPVTDIGYIAMIAMYDRYKVTGKWGASGEEFKALKVMVDFAADYWSRRSFAQMKQAMTELRYIRQKQYAEVRRESDKHPAGHPAQHETTVVQA